MNIADLAGLQPSPDQWWRRANCAGQPWERMFPDNSSSRRGQTTLADDRALRICALCPVRRPCLTEALKNEAPTRFIVRSVIPEDSVRKAVRDFERAIPAGIFGGQTAKHRHDFNHFDDCSGPCRGCRPIDDRVDLLEARFIAEAPALLTRSEKVVA